MNNILKSDIFLSIVFYSLIIFSFTLFFFSFPYALYVDEAIYLNEVLSVKTKVLELGLSNWFQNLFLFDDYTSSRYGYIASLWTLFLDKDYTLIHFFHNLTYLLLISFFLKEILKKYDESFRHLLKATLVLTIPYFIFSTLWFLKELPFIAFFLGSLFFTMQYKEQNNKINFFLLTCFFLLTLLVRPILGFLLFSSIFFMMIKNKLAYLGLYSLYVIILMISVEWVSRYLSISIELALFFLFCLLYGLFLYFTKARKQMIEKIKRVHLLSIPIMILYMAPLIRFIYANFLSKSATDITNVFSFSDFGVKIANLVIGFNILLKAAYRP